MTAVTVAEAVTVAVTALVPMHQHGKRTDQPPPPQ
jgi:hypothetical protein